MDRREQPTPGKTLGIAQPVHRTASRVSALVTCSLLTLSTIGSIAVSASDANFRVDTVGAGERVDEVCETDSGLWIAVSTANVGSALVSRFGFSGKNSEDCNPPDKINKLLGTNPNNSIEALCANGNTLWIGTREGRVFRLDTTNECNEPEPMLTLGLNDPDPAHSSRRTIRALHLDGNVLWIGTEEPDLRGGLYKWEIGSGVIGGQPLGTFSSKVNAIHGARDTLYIGLEHGLFECDKKSPSTFRPFPEVLKEYVIRGLYDNGQSLWIGTSRALYRWDQTKKETTRVVLDFSEVRVLYGHGAALFVGSDRGLFRIDGGTGPWTVPVQKSGEYRKSIPTGSQLVVHWKLGDCKRRTSPDRVQQRVIVYNESGRQVNEQEESVDQSQDGFSFTFNGASTPGVYRLELQATDLNGVVSTLDLHKFSVEAPASLGYVISWVVGFPLGADFLVFCILLVLSRQSQKAFDILTGPFTGKVFLYFRYALLYSVWVRLWVFDRYFQLARRDFMQKREYLDREMELIGGPDSMSSRPARIATDELLGHLQNHPHIHVVGRSGTGKTEMIYALMHSYFQMDDLNKAWHKYKFIPIFLRVRDCQTLAIQLLARNGLARYQMAFDETSFFEKLLRQGGFLIVLDGLNEGRLDDELKKYERPQSVRLLMTSQTDLGIADIAHYRLPDFTPEFTKTLLHLLLEDDDKRLRASEISDELLTDIRSGYDVRLIAALINSNRKDLPAHRFDLFRDVADNAFAANPDVPRDRLCKLAWALWTSGNRGFGPSDGITEAHLESLSLNLSTRDRGRIVVSRGDHYEFRHDQMRDYLAACWATRHAASIAVTLTLLNNQNIWTGLSPDDQKYVFEFLTHEVGLDDLKKVAVFAAEDIGHRVQLFAAAKAEADRRGSPLEIQ